MKCAIGSAGIVADDSGADRGQLKCDAFGDSRSGADR